MSLMSPLDCLFLPVMLSSKSVLEQTVNVVMNPFFFYAQILCATLGHNSYFFKNRKETQDFASLVSVLCVFYFGSYEEGLPSTHLDALLIMFC